LVKEGGKEHKKLNKNNIRDTEKTVLDITARVNNGFNIS
jgi:hypothetical protein